MKKVNLSVYLAFIMFFLLKCNISAGDAGDYTVSGTVTDLASAEVPLVLTLTSGEKTEDLTVTTSTFTFTTGLSSDDSYDVIVKTQPEKIYQNCTADSFNSSGTISEASVSDIEVACVNETPDWGSIVPVVKYENGDNMKISVTWTVPQYTVSYKIKRCSGTCYTSGSFTEIGTSTTLSYVDLSPPVSGFPTIYYMIEAVDGEKTANSKKSAAIVAGLIKINALDLMTMDQTFIDFLDATSGTIFKLDIPSAAVYYLFVDGNLNDADITVYNSQTGAETDNNNSDYYCNAVSAGTPPCLGEAISTATAEQIELTVSNGTGSYPLTLYFRIWNYAGSSSVVKFGGRTTSYPDATATASFTYTNN